MIFYLIGGMILVTFIASIIHFFAADSDFSSFFIEDGGFVTISICLIVGFCVIGCVYGSVGLSILIALTLLIPLIACTIHYSEEMCSDLREYFVDYNGWVTLLISGGIPLTICASIYGNTLWALVVGCTLIFSLIFASIHYSESSCDDIAEFLTEECGWAFPLLFVTIGSTILCAVYFNTTLSLIIGITLTVMIIASMIHYASAYSDSFFDFITEDFGWITNVIVLSIGAIVLGCVYGHVWDTVFWAVSVIVTAISCAIHVDSSCSYDFEDFFLDDKGWLNISICALISFTLYGFIFWEASKTFVVMISFIVLTIAMIIHYSLTKSRDLEDFLYDNHGFLTFSTVVTLGCAVFEFAFCEFSFALITTVSLALSIVLGLITNIRICETYFIHYFATKKGAIYSYLPLLAGGLFKGIIWSNWWMLIISTVVYLIFYIACAILASKKPYTVKKTPIIPATPTKPNGGSTGTTKPRNTTGITKPNGGSTGTAKPRNTTGITKPNGGSTGTTKPKNTTGTTKPNGGSTGTTKPKNPTKPVVTPPNTIDVPADKKTTSPLSIDDTPIMKHTTTTLSIDDAPVYVGNKVAELVLDIDTPATLVIDTDDK